MHPGTVDLAFVPFQKVGQVFVPVLVGTVAYELASNDGVSCAKVRGPITFPTISTDMSQIMGSSGGRGLYCPLNISSLMEFILFFTQLSRQLAEQAGSSSGNQDQKDDWPSYAASRIVSRGTRRTKICTIC